MRILAAILSLFIYSLCSAGQGMLPYLPYKAAGSPPTTPVITATPGNTTNTITLTSGDVGALTNVLYWDTTSRATYDLYANSISNATLVAASFPGTPYVHTGRTNGVPYYYMLRGTDVAGSTSSAEVSGTPAGSGADAEITMYFNCNANTADQPLTKGTGNTQYTGDFTAAAAVVGNGLGDSRAWYQFGLPTGSGNLSSAAGTIGLFWRATSISDGAFVLEAEVTPGSSPHFAITTTSTAISWAFASSNQDATVVINHRYFVEISWSVAGSLMAHRVWDETGGAWIVGPSWSEQSYTGTPPTIASFLNFGAASGVANAQDFDQILGSTIYKKDLNSVRVSTSP